MSKYGEKKTGGSDKSEQPGGGRIKGRQTHVAELKVALEITGNQPYAESHYRKPAIIDAHRNPVHLGNGDALLKERSDAHNSRSSDCKIQGATHHPWRSMFN